VVDTIVLLRLDIEIAAEPRSQFRNLSRMTAAVVFPEQAAYERVWLVHSIEENINPERQTRAIASKKRSSSESVRWCETAIVMP